MVPESRSASLVIPQVWSRSAHAVAYNPRGSTCRETPTRCWGPNTQLGLQVAFDLNLKVYSPLCSWDSTTAFLCHWGPPLPHRIAYQSSLICTFSQVYQETSISLFLPGSIIFQHWQGPIVTHGAVTFGVTVARTSSPNLPSHFLVPVANTQ